MSRARVLIVEDDVSLREALSDTLRSAGYAVCSAADGESALAVLERERIDVVLSDVQMAPLDGHALLKAVKQAHPALPVILITAYGTIQKAVAAMHDGAADYLVKPFELDAVIALIERYAATADAYHLSSLAPEAEGSRRSMSLAVADAGLKPEQIGYVSAHATSTPGGDGEEAAAIAAVFAAGKENLHVSGVKSMTGHLLGGAGAMGAFAAILAIRDGIVPPTLNLDNPSESCMGVNLVPKVAQERRVRAALSNSFRFGGTNASLVFKEFA